MAAVLAIGGGAVTCYRSGAALWGFRKPESGPVDVMVARRVRSRKGIRVHPVRSLDPADITRHHASPSPRRRGPCWTSSTSSLGPRPLRRALRQAEVDRRVNHRQLREQLARAGGRRGATALAALIARGPAPTRSGLEDDFLDFVDRHGLPRPESNVHAGPFEVDFLYRPERLVVETDSREFHDTPTAREEDRLKDARRQALGHHVLRIRDEDLTVRAASPTPASPPPSTAARPRRPPAAPRAARSSTSPPSRSGAGR